MSVEETLLEVLQVEESQNKVPPVEVISVEIFPQNLKESREINPSIVEEQSTSTTEVTQPNVIDLIEENRRLSLMLLRMSKHIDVDKIFVEDDDKNLISHIIKKERDSMIQLEEKIILIPDETKQEQSLELTSVMDDSNRTNRLEESILNLDEIEQNYSNPENHYEDEISPILDEESQSEEIMTIMDSTNQLEETTAILDDTEQNQTNTTLDDSKLISQVEESKPIPDQTHSKSDESTSVPDESNLSTEFNGFCDSPIVQVINLCETKILEYQVIQNESMIKSATSNHDDEPASPQFEEINKNSIKVILFNKYYDNHPVPPSILSSDLNNLAICLAEDISSIDEVLPLCKPRRTYSRVKETKNQVPPKI